MLYSLTTAMFCIDIKQVGFSFWFIKKMLSSEFHGLQDVHHLLSKHHFFWIVKLGIEVAEFTIN